MIKLECISLKGFLECASFLVKEGDICSLITETDFEKNIFIKVITGLARPDSGQVFIFDKDISLISYTELNNVRKRIGVVLSDGGLVSNLKVWENIMLPLNYHKSLGENSEEEMMRLLSKVGYDDDTNMLPGPLPDYKKRLAGLVRVMLMEPDLMVYDSIFDGLSPDVKNRILETVNSFHQEKKGRASLFIASSEGSVEDIKADSIYELKKGKFYERN